MVLVSRRKSRVALRLKAIVPMERHCPNKFYGTRCFFRSMVSLQSPLQTWGMPHGLSPICIQPKFRAKPLLPVCACLKGILSEWILPWSFILCYRGLHCSQLFLPLLSLSSVPLVLCIGLRHTL